MNRKEFRLAMRAFVTIIIAALIGVLAAFVMYLLIFMFFGL